MVQTFFDWLVAKYDLEEAKKRYREWENAN